MKMKLIGLMLLFGSAASMVNAVESSNNASKKSVKLIDADFAKREEHFDQFFGKEARDAKTKYNNFNKLLNNNNLTGKYGEPYKNSCTKQVISREEAV